MIQEIKITFSSQMKPYEIVCAFQAKYRPYPPIANRVIIN
jgi:hypothetical protein